MKATLFLTASLLMAAGSAPAANSVSPVITGDYLEVRTCDVYTGYCVANSQMNLEGREAILVWSVKQGAWNGVALDGLKVIAVVRAESTLGDLRYQPAAGRAVLVVDASASELQKQALAGFARSASGGLIREVAEVKSSDITACIGSCAKEGCAAVEAGQLVRVNTRCFGAKDHLCGNEETYYPPLTRVTKPQAAFTEIASYQGSGLDLTFQAAGQRSAFIAGFTL